MKRAYFLSGQVGVGKSTLIGKVLQRHPDWGIGGFRTVSLIGEDHIRHVYIVDAGETDPILNENNQVGTCNMGKGSRGIAENFDRIGAALLAPRKCDLVLMDELGRMERDAHLFQTAVLETVRKNIPVLGVMKPSSIPFLDDIRAEENMEEIFVTAENRNDLTDMLDEKLTKAIEEYRLLRSTDSCGLAVLRKGENEPEVLLIQNRKKCSFPKGHMEQGEAEEETALRETLEETGITACILPETRHVMPSARADEDRKIICFAARYVSGIPKPQHGETDQVFWIPLSQAADCMSFESDAEWMRILSNHGRILNSDIE